MSKLSEKKCVPCEGGTKPLGPAETKALLEGLDATWIISDDHKSLQRSYKFRDFYRTMSFMGALAHIANSEDHHPDVRLGYNYCHVTFTTHAIGGLSENDFICAAKLDRIS
ncbi:MAG: 4a-hydroxytetrahydrobiopterin dehydratase [Steroidobacterales bacterium]